MRCAARPANASAAQPANSSDATAQAAAEEECFRAVVDLREIDQKLAKHKFEEKAKRLECAENKAMCIPSNELLSMFDPATWTQCFSEFWYGDALPNMSEQEQNRGSLSKNSSKRFPIVMSSNLSLLLTALPSTLCRGVDSTHQNILSFSETP